MRARRGRALLAGPARGKSGVQAPCVSPSVSKAGRRRRATPLSGGDPGCGLRSYPAGRLAVEEPRWSTWRQLGRVCERVRGGSSGVCVSVYVRMQCAYARPRVACRGV